jgi:hypothetical protein
MIKILSVPVFFVLFHSCTGSNSDQKIELFPEPVVSTSCRGIPVYTYGYTDILSESPDLTDSVKMQVGNQNPLVKVNVKKSREIISNRLGTTTPRMPRTAANDYLPLEPVCLIDGDTNTCWSSKTVSQADAEPAWIRIDLPVEREITRIVLYKRRQSAARYQPGSVSPQPGAVEVGMGVPAHLEINISRDAAVWKTLFSGNSGDKSGMKEFTAAFTPCLAKQIWIIGTGLPKVENWLHSFSIAEVEIIDKNGNNLALVSRGSGVTVSSTQHSMGQTRDEQRWLWPVHADLGLKWVRVGYHDDPINWHWVEKEKGKLEIDPEADAAITYLVKQKIDIDFVLAFGNRLYSNTDPARKLPQLWEWYYETPMPPTTPEALKAWERYVRFITHHFKGRVKVFEIWNEWNIAEYWGAKPDLNQYLTIVKRTIPIIRKECPEAKIMLGSVSGFTSGISQWTSEELRRKEKEVPFLQAIGEMADKVDIIGWHPFYQTDTESEIVKSYPADVLFIKKWAAQKGFHGEFFASEWNYGANYPAPTPPNWWGDFLCSELDKAKYIARLTVLHTALDINSFFCETWSNYYPLDLTLLRRSFAGSPVSVQQPQAGYYVMRNLATALDELKAARFECKLTPQDRKIECYKMERKDEKVMALWLPGHANDNFSAVPVQIEMDGHFTSAWGYDCLNGVNQELITEIHENHTLIKNLLVRDYPILIRFTNRKTKSIRI